MPRKLLFLLLAVALGWLAPAAARPVAAQFDECGVVTAIDYPLDINDTFERQFDDFARFRRRFGGLHTGFDLAFYRHLEPVRAAADGRVTYADPAGWDTELGVVIIRHDFPDGSVYYSLYGHMEESDAVRFPAVGSCVRRGDVVGLVGDPSLSAPHLHYEIRDFMPDDGGPGYVQTNPRTQGWYHPLDFTDLWRIRLGTGYLSSVTFDTAPDLPPVVLDTGAIAIASGPALSTMRLPDTPLWQITAAEDITGLAALPGDQLAAVSGDGAVSVFAGGRYAARWLVDTPPVAPVVLGDLLVFAGDAALTAYDSAGTVVWQADGLYDRPEQVMSLAANGASVALTTRADGRYHWLLLDATGQELFERDLSRQPVAAAGPNGSWYVLDGADVLRVDGDEARSVGSTGQTHGRTATLAVDPLGNSYVYLGDRAGTFLSLGQAGELRWRATYPLQGASLPPLMAVGSGCTLVTLDADGIINLFDADTGVLAQQLVLYAGGEDTARPDGRLLAADANDRLLVGAGFQSVALLDVAAIMATTSAECLLG